MILCTYIYIYNYVYLIQCVYYIYTYIYICQHYIYIFHQIQIDHHVKPFNSKSSYFLGRFPFYLSHLSMHVWLSNPHLQMTYIHVCVYILDLYIYIYTYLCISIHTDHLDVYNHLDRFQRSGRQKKHLGSLVDYKDMIPPSNKILHILEKKTRGYPQVSDIFPLFG